MLQFNNLSLKDWSEIMNKVQGVTFEPFDKVEVTSAGGVTAISFVNTEEEVTKKQKHQLVLEILASSDQPMKYIVMGKTEYNEMGNWSLRPFGSLHEAIAYGEKLTTRDSHGYRSYHDFVIQPLLKDMNSFELTSEQIGMIRDIENSVLA